MEVGTDRRRSSTGPHHPYTEALLSAVPSVDGEPSRAHPPRRRDPEPGQPAERAACSTPAATGSSKGIVRRRPSRPSSRSSPATASAATSPSTSSAGCSSATAPDPRRRCASDRHPDHRADPERRSGRADPDPGRARGRRPRAGVHPPPDPRLRAARRGGPGAHRDEGRPDPGRGRHRDPRRRRRAAVCSATPGPPSTAHRVRFDPGHVRALCATAPRQFTQLARNPARSVEIGGDAVVFAPAYGSPFVRDLAGGRRYALAGRLRELRQAGLRRRRGCTTRAARCASRSTSRSTSATSTWCTPTCATATRR